MTLAAGTRPSRYEISAQVARAGWSMSIARAINAGWGML
jgi:hypothetical protein